MRWLAFVLPLLVLGTAQADPRVDRLTHLGKLWGAIAFGSPHVWSHDVDLDKLVVEAIARVSAAGSTDEYRAAVAAMLEGIGDPVTRVADPREAPGPLPAMEGEYLRVEKGVLLVTLRRWPAPPATPLADLRKALETAPAVVLDLRGAPYPAAAMFDELGNVFSKRTVYGPTTRRVRHSGYRPQDGIGGGYETSASISVASEHPSRPGARARRTVFLVSNQSPVPAIAFALATAGEAWLVSDGRFIPEFEHPVDMGEGVRAIVRVSDVEPAVKVEVEVPAGKDPVAAALTLAAGTSKKRPAPARPLPPLRWRSERTYADQPYPSRELRVLALYRYWNVVHYFYPYLKLIDDWEPVLPEFIPKLEAAGNALEYAQAVAELTTRVPDGHSRVIKRGALGAYLGEAGPLVSVKLVEGQPTISRVEPGLAVNVGDVLVAVDGEPVAKRAARLARFVSASSTAIRDHRVAAMLLRGPPDVPAKVSVRGADGKVRDVELPRKMTRPPDPPRDQIVKVLPGNIGYVMMAALDPSAVDPMFAQLKDTRAIVFDMRGYPRGAGGDIALKINRKKARSVAHFERPELEALAPRRMTFEQGFGPPQPPVYDRPTVMLIDERAQSQSEHTGLLFEAASGTKFVGSPTAGANGDVTSISLPGGLTVGMTGHDVRHADGRQLQRIGLVPDVKVEPTLAGVRQGKDEVLDAALRYLEGCLAGKTPAKDCP